MLKAEIKVSTGVLYHHLQKLIEANLVFQRPDREYELTHLGTSVALFLEQYKGKEIPLMANSSLQGSKFSVRIQNFFDALPFASVVLSHKYHLLIETVLILAICVNFQLQLGLWFLGPFLMPTFLTFPWFLLLELGGMILQVFAMEMVPRVAFGRTENPQALAIGNFSLGSFSALSILLLWSGAQLAPEIPSLIYWPVVIILQLIYLLLGAQLLVKLKRLSWDRALLVSLGSQYLFLVLSQFLISLA